MRRIAMSFMTIAAVFALAVGATSAYFTDSATLQRVTFATGTLSVVDASPNWSIVNIGNLKPGDTVRKWVTLRNDGTLAVDYLNVQANNVVNPALLQQLDLSIAADKTGTGSGVYTPNWTGGAKALPWMSTPADVLDTTYYGPATGVILPGESYTMSFDFTFPTTMGNEWQGQTASFEMVFTAEQSHVGVFYGVQP